MNLYNLHYLFLLILLIPLLLMLFQRARRNLKRFARYADEQFHAHYLGAVSPFYATLKSVLMILALAAVILALVRPQWDYESRELQSQGLDIIICLDISKSMDAADLLPSRLQRAKLQIQSFIDRLSGDRLGIVAFAGVPTLECPLTDDYESVKMVLRSLETSSAVKLGTDIGAALEMAERAFDASGGSNVLILISDGEDLERRAIQSAARLGSAGINIYTMGVGSEGGARVYDPVTGEEAISTPDLQTLQLIAEKGGGKFFAVTPSQNEIDLLLESIYTLEKGNIRGSRFNTLKEQFHLFASFALLLLMIESLILPLKRKRKSP
ncbi:MAG: VWA domain-containing protein [Candidatus Cloacimonadaceae bacterium]|nr:VWA domain-containing protein [Candidatus Cloacimonadaceae bacterium]MDP3113467.1 VWA domain-containing protein [Candidatus Cloacimonadaceae bacterium]